MQAYNVVLLFVLFLFVSCQETRDRKSLEFSDYSSGISSYNEGWENDDYNDMSGPYQAGDSDDCLTAWSQWSNCDSCGGVQTRDRWCFIDPQSMKSSFDSKKEQFIQSKLSQLASLKDGVTYKLMTPLNSYCKATYVELKKCPVLSSCRDRDDFNGYPLVNVEVNVEINYYNTIVNSPYQSYYR